MCVICCTKNSTSLLHVRHMLQDLRRKLRLVVLLSIDILKLTKRMFVMLMGDILSAVTPTSSGIPFVKERARLIQGKIRWFICRLFS